jgi:hypothetical protein
MNKQFEHIEASAANGFPSIEVTDVIGFVRLLEANKIKFIFRKNAVSAESPPEEFFCPLNNTLYTIKANNFIALEDYYNAVEKKFPGAQEYYEAQKSGFDSFEEFKHSISSGGASKELFDEAKAAGFVRGFEAFGRKYEGYKSNKHTALIIDKDLDSSLKLYEYAKNKGIKTYHDFEMIYDAGYPDPALYNEATAKEFENADDFFAATRKGFTIPYEYQNAKEKKIGSKKEYDDYQFLKSGNIHNYGYDEFQLLLLLQEMENGKKLSIAQLRKTLIEEQDKYKRAFTGNEVKLLPVWYVQKIANDEQLHTFMKECAEVKKFGTYHEKEKSFEIFKINKTKVYVDASNVAHNSAANGKVIPTFRNLRILVQELAVWKFTDIIVIADASLKHKAKDVDELQRVKKLASYHESPSHTSADKFLLDLIHHEKCIIISNDTFSDWQQKDFWVKKNIDKIRVPFMIKDDKVLFFGIEKHAPK